MSNVFDDKMKYSLNFILQDNVEDEVIGEQKYNRSVVVAFLYYIEDSERYFEKLDQIDERISLVVITSLEDYRLIIDKHFHYRNNFHSVIKPNEGRDISALLITAKPIIDCFEYVCFVHDKRAHNEVVKEDTDLWVANIWGNLIKNSKYINQVLTLLEKRDDIGVLVPPMPIGKNYSTWFGFGWHGSYEVTKSIATLLGLKCEIVPNKPPITIGTAIWFRTDALKKLFGHKWKYSDFNDSKLNDKNYLSYGIERIFAYVAQDAGYRTAEIMNIEYAQIQNAFIQYASSELLSASNQFFPISNLTMLEKYANSCEELIEFCGRCSSLFIYGSGNLGRFVNTLLRRHGIEASGFIDSDELKQGKIIDMLNVVGIETIAVSEVGIICAIADENSQKEVEKKLVDLNFSNYYVFMK